MHEVTIVVLNSKKIGNSITEKLIPVKTRKKTDFVSFRFNKFILVIFSPCR